MNVIKARQEKRRVQINDIKASIKIALDNNKKIDFNSIVMATSSNLGLSKRTSQEYAELALFELKLTKEELEEDLHKDDFSIN